MATRSASSITPRLMACRSSPAFGNCSSAKQSVMPATAVSLWPTPTVSTITTSWPAASSTSIASRVLAVTPPSVPPVGLGRMKASASTDRRSMRVLSPRIEPPDTLDDGSTASTATRCRCFSRCRPSASMKVDLPTPGTPEMPSRNDWPLAGSSALSNSSARAAMVGPRRLQQRDRLGDRAALRLAARVQHAVEQGLVRSDRASARLGNRATSSATRGSARARLSRSPGSACPGRRCP